MIKKVPATPQKKGGNSGGKPKSATNSLKSSRSGPDAGNKVPAGRNAQAGKEAGRSKQKLIKVAVIAVILLLALLLWKGSCSQKAVQPPPQTNKGADSGAVSERGAPSPQPGAGRTAAPREAKGNEEPAVGPVVSSVRITPTQPLASDQIKAKAALAGGDGGGVNFLYRWKVNDRFVAGAGTDTLAAVELKRHDRISVVVSALRDGREGPRTESQTVVVYSLPPSLEMKILTTQYRPGDAAEIQLSGAAPDGDKIVFSLVPPFVEGMKIDENSGRITWKPQRLLPGKLQFGAAASDTDGNRTSRVFEIDLGAGPSS